jgi:hypothetical protein
MMTTTHSSAVSSWPAAFGWLTLRNVLRFDALTCAAMGAALLLARMPLAELLGAPPALLQWAGIVLFPSAAAMVLAAATLSTWLVRLVIAGNVAWIVASAAVLYVFSLSALGVAFVIVQAAAVAVLAALEAGLGE